MKANQNHIVEPNKKVSSVEYLISQLQKSKDWQRVLNEVSQMSSVKIDIIEQAKAMHKKQSFETFKAGQDSMEEGGKGFDQWYQETFGGNNEH